MGVRSVAGAVWGFSAVLGKPGKVHGVKTLWPVFIALLYTIAALPSSGRASELDLEPVDVPAQPLAANVGRLVEALKIVGAPMAGETAVALKQAGEAGDARLIQRRLDPHVLLVVELNPEERV